jgi:carbamoyl-phosphate synthase large subunit
MKGLGRIALPNRPDRVLVLGSGALQIGQAGEFDYSGSQALKALKEEGIYTALVNPNIATIQTSPELADEVYFLPVEPEFVERILTEERIDAVLLSFGGQTALACGLALDSAGVLARLGVRVLGTPTETIRATEDRQLFAEKMHEIGAPIARSRVARTPREALEAAADIGYPVILRAGFSLGGRGSSIVRDEQGMRAAVDRALGGVPQVLVEECLAGWKEVEYEVVRDGSDNCITVCNMENVDPMGIHTGDSVVVAPTQTLDDRDHQMLRDTALRAVRHLGVVGECNIQFALDPRSRDYRVIEVNARLSRSSALASKATGYPLAYVAAKIAVGYDLPQIANAITRATTAFFEPALDYVVCKIPRWDLDKFDGVDRTIGPEMKSVGEVMAIGRSFPEALQKALRMLEIGVDGFDPRAWKADDIQADVRTPSPRRLLAVARALWEGMAIDEVARLTSIDRFFVAEMARIVDFDRRMGRTNGDALAPDLLLDAKRLGFSDHGIASRTHRTEEVVRARRRELGIRPRLVQIDTLAAEYPAETNYLYLTYAAEAPDISPSPRRSVLVLGSGCYRIGSSVEFDWCCVSAAGACRDLGYETILLNCNPETVSTDYDVCDRLVFDEISIENVLEICDYEKPEGVVVSMGGQTPNNIALELHEAGVRILGTPPESIDRAEDRRKFSALCDELGIDQPSWSEATALSDLDATVASLGGYPVIVRPSYVLSGAAMRVAHGSAELRGYLAKATAISPEHPVVISKYERHAREMEFDAVAKDGEVVLWAISEHVENAGVHSGDATLVLPPQRAYLETIRRMRRIASSLARALRITGPFNIQMLSRYNDVKVIECNLRASRSFPFVSKTVDANFAAEAARVMLGAGLSSEAARDPLDLDHVAVKVSQFSFRRLPGVDPILGVEMASTGEVACLGETMDEALLEALMSTGFRLPKRGVLLSLGPIGDKYQFTEEALLLRQMGLALYATPGTAEILRAESLPCEVLAKNGEGGSLRKAIDLLREGAIDLVVNVPREYDERGTGDGFQIRRCAVDLEVPLVTDLALARAIVRALAACRGRELPVRSWRGYLQRNTRQVTQTSGSLSHRTTGASPTGASAMLLGHPADG